MPNWLTDVRGENRLSEIRSYDGATGLDGYSDMDHENIPGRSTIRDVEDITMLHGIGLKEMEGDEESGRDDNEQ